MTIALPDPVTSCDFENVLLICDHDTFDGYSPWNVLQHEKLAYPKAHFGLVYRAHIPYIAGHAYGCPDTSLSM